MKKSTKIWMGISTGVVVAATAGTLLGIYIPQLLTQKNITDLVEKQVKPSEGNGSYLRSVIKNAIGTTDSSFGDIKTFAQKALATTEGYESVLNNTIVNYLVQFFKYFKSSDAFAERYKTWIEDIDTEWTNLVDSYKKKHGGVWEYYFQVNVLDPLGGNEADWKRDKLCTNVETAFNDFVFQNLYINALDTSGNVIAPTSSPTQVIKEYLYSGDLVNGVGGDGERNRVQFVPSKNNTSATSSYAPALANLQSFIFDQYVEDYLPVVTSMTLYKHNEPQKNSKSNFFNIEKARQLNDPIGLTDVVGTEASYKWQTFAPEAKPVDSSGEYTPTATNKFLNFVANKNKLVNTTTGAIEIPVKNYTDDSSTLYYVKMSDMFSTSYTQYASAVNYKFNSLVHSVTDANVPSAALKSAQLNTTPGTEIMSNFMNTAATANGYFTLPTQITNIINDDAGFTGGYNGIKSITDTVNILDGSTASPFVMTRNESGVHIIGIDRYTKIAAGAAVDYDGALNEIKNTILWRHTLGEFGLSSNTGFSLDLKTELKNYFIENRDRLLFEYIAENESSSTLPPEQYIFSSKFTNVDNIGKLADSSYFDYLSAWNTYSNNITKLKHKDLVKEKVLGLQSDYTNKLYGNSVINNGIAGVLPYSRTNTADTYTNIGTDNVVDKEYGYYASLDVYQPDGTKFSEITTHAILKDIEETVIPALYTKLEASKIGLKALTYSSAKYNQYLQIGTSSARFGTTNEYANEGDVLNEAVASWIDSSEPKNIIEIEKLLSDINYDQIPGQTTGNVLDDTNWALTSTYTNPTTTITTAPVITGNKKDYVSYYLQKAYDVNVKLPSVVEKLSENAQNGVAYNDLLQLAKNKWASDILFNEESGTANDDYLKEIAALKYAFDYNEATQSYDFTKFRDYLLDQTTNNKKASYVWITNDKIDIIKDYKAAATGIKDLYTYKTDIMAKNAGAYGYAYQGATNTGYRDATTGMWQNTVTFNDSNNYFNNVPITSTNTVPFTGFTGMQFESNASADLPSSIRENLFSDNIRVYDTYTASSATAAPSDTNIAIKGALYNYGSRANYVNHIKTQLTSWSQVNEVLRWFADTFNIDVVNVSKTNLTEAIAALATIAGDNTKLPDLVFARNEEALLVNSNYSTVQPTPDSLPFYYDSASTGYSNTGVITQFNHDDVIKLFDTSGNGSIASDDVGINWTIAANGFLGSSSEAFFMSAFNWYTSQSSYSTTAYNATIERQSKITVYDRRLNNSLTKSLVSNFKENNTSE